VNYELSGSELKLNWKITKSELKLKGKYMGEHSNEFHGIGIHDN
jgi:hypothetical protein